MGVSIGQQHRAELQKKRENPALFFIQKNCNQILINMSDEEYYEEEEEVEEEEEEEEYEEEEEEEAKEAALEKKSVRSEISQGESDGNYLRERLEAKKGALDEQLMEYIDEWRKQRAKEEDELQRLKEKQAKRKEVRAEQEKKLAQQKKRNEKGSKRLRKKDKQ